VPDLYIFHLTPLTTTLLNKLFIPSRHGFVATRPMLSMLKSDPGLFNRLYSLSHRKWQKDGLKTVGTHSRNSITCNHGQRNTIYTREQRVVVRISIVSNPAPLFLLPLQARSLLSPTDSCRNPVESGQFPEFQRNQFWQRDLPN
jgi:hypothetical protein